MSGYYHSSFRCVRQVWFTLTMVYIVLRLSMLHLNSIDANCIDSRQFRCVHHHFLKKWWWYFFSLSQIGTLSKNKKNKKMKSKLAGTILIVVFIFFLNNFVLLDFIYFVCLNVMIFHLLYIVWTESGSSLWADCSIFIENCPISTSMSSFIGRI